jgi:hypothetical protein
MTTQGRINPETLSAFLEGLPDLLESLRAQGYGLGTRQHVAAHELVGSLFARGALPPTLPELDEWLAPLLCFTPAQQEDFRERYLQWLRENDFAPPQPVRRIVGGEEKDAEEGERQKEKTRLELFKDWLRAHRRQTYLAGGAAAFALALAFYFAAAPCPLSGPGPCPTPTPAPTPAPTPTAEVTPTAEPSPAQTSEPTPTPNVTTTPEPTPDVGLAWDLEKPPVGKAETADLSKVELDDTLPPAGFLERNFETLVALVLVSPFAALGLWQLLRLRRRRRDAERWERERPRYDKIKVLAARERVFQSAALRPVARGLRHYLSVESRQLDARSTVLASAGRGGLFTPVYGRRRTLPEYLVLIDRVGFGDQLAQFNSDIVARLAERDVYIDTYYFHGDPRRCREGGPDSPQLSLSDLAARHPDHYLLIFSDGTGLMSTTTGRPEPFVEQLLFWRGRALLTPIPRLEWEYREWALEREGLKVLPATLDGLRLLVDAVNTGPRATRAPDFDDTPPYPDILRQQPALWKEREAPPAHQARRLVTHLRRYLGPEGFELLCACAVYPVMQWGVTLFLAYELLERKKVDELLPRLLRLPWFRNGTMPQWLRRTLVREMPRARRRLVRERLEHLLLAFLEAPDRGLRPRFAEEHAAQEAGGASLMTRLGERLEAWRRSRLLRRRLEHAPARSPLAEPVFLNYITNNQSAEALPEPVRHKLFPRGVPAFGLRLAPAAALVTVAVLTGLLLLLLERPVEAFYTPGFPPNLMSLLLAPMPEAVNSTDPDFTYAPTTGRPGRSYKLVIRGIDLGEYDFTRMDLRAEGAAARWLTFDARHDGARTLYTTLNIAPDAPTGPSDLLLYEGDNLRARLPFTVTAATQAVQRQCPDIRLRVVSYIANAAITYTKIAKLALDSPPTDPTLTYFWSGGPGIRVAFGQGTRAATVNSPLEAEGAQLLRVKVGGLPAGCPNTATYNLADVPVTTPTTTTPQLTVTAQPQTVTVCPSDPKLNEPPDSTVKVSVSLSPPDINATFDARASAGKLDQTGVSRANTPTYDWNLSGVSPGAYTVRLISSVQRSPVTASVTVKGCPREAPTPSGEQRIPDLTTGPGGAADTGQTTPAGRGRVVVTLLDRSGKPWQPDPRPARVIVDLSRLERSARGEVIASRVGRIQQASPDGTWVFDNVPTGMYQVDVRWWRAAGGDWQFTRSQTITLQSGETRNLSITLK